MSDPWLASMLVQSAAVYHQHKVIEADGQQTEGYPAAPDISALPCMTVRGGKQFAESPVGLLLDSDGLMWCEAADVRETDRVHIGAQVFYVNGTPLRYQNPWTTAVDKNAPWLMEIGLKEEKDVPA